MHSPSRGEQVHRSTRSRAVHVGEALAPGAHPLADPTVVASADRAGHLIHVPCRNSTIRLSVGLEDPADIIADLEKALAALLQATPLEEM